MHLFLRKAGSGLVQHDHTGTHAPGRELMFDALPVAHHQLLGHGLAVRALRASGAAEVMLTNNCTPVRPASDSAADLAAAAVYDGFHNRLFLDPVLLGENPMLDGAPCVREGDREIIATPLDLSERSTRKRICTSSCGRLAVGSSSTITRARTRPGAS